MTLPPNQIETEVKFHLNDIDAMRSRLGQLGAKAGVEHHEINVRYEDATESLKRNDRLLRLRQDDRCRLTVKERPAVVDTECKSYRELEVEVSHFDTMAAILDVLGFRAAQRYDKRRQVFNFDQVEICLDTMPFGTFMEIEGTAGDIKEAAALLSLPWPQRILTNYLSIFERLRTHADLPFTDVTFENFAGLQVDITPLLPQLWAAEMDT